MTSQLPRYRFSDIGQIILLIVVLARFAIGTAPKLLAATADVYWTNRNSSANFTGANIWQAAAPGTADRVNFTNVNTHPARCDLTVHLANTSSAAVVF